MASPICSSKDGQDAARDQELVNASELVRLALSAIQNARAGKLRK